MPVESPDYKQISEYNKIVHNNESIKAKDLIVGATYLTKNNEEYVYMGKFDYYSYGYRWVENGEYKTSKNIKDIPLTYGNYYKVRIPNENIDYLYGKYFWFAYKYYDYGYDDNWNKVYKDTYTWKFEQFKSIPKNKFITCVDEKCILEYPELYESMIRTYNFSPRDYDNAKYIPYSFDEFKEYTERKEDLYNRNDYRRYNTYFFSDGHYKYKVNCNDKTNLWTVEQVSINRLNSTNDEDYYGRFNFQEIKKPGYYSWRCEKVKEIIPMTIETLYEKLKPCYKEIYLDNGYLYERECFYGNKE